MCFRALLLGSVGVKISQAMASAFAPEKGFYSANGVLFTERDPKVEVLRQAVSCLGIARNESP
jgi:hypothetical protein